MQIQQSAACPAKRDIPQKNGTSGRDASRAIGNRDICPVPVPVPSRPSGVPVSRPASIVAKAVAAQASGMSLADIAQHLATSAKEARRVVAEAEGAGLVVRVRFGTTRTVWMSPTEHARVLERRRQANARASRETYRRRKAAGLIHASGLLKDPPDWQIERRIVRAGDVPPPVTTGVRSVFEVAGECPYCHDRHTLSKCPRWRQRARAFAPKGGAV